jgi:hypothetical protein
MSALTISPHSSFVRGSISSLQELIYQTFSGSNFVKQSDSIHLKVLSVLIRSSDLDLSLVEKVFNAALEDFETTDHSKKSEVSADFPSFGDSDELIDISHGGGRHFLQAFLKGGHIGYATEAGGQGIFVTTDSKKRIRDINYAVRTPLAHFDDPVIMTAKIAKRHLLQVNHNSYEAVLSQRSIQHLQNIEIKNLELKKIPNWKLAVADLLPLIPFTFFGEEEKYLTQALEKTNKYSADDIRDIVSCLLPFYN